MEMYVVVRKYRPLKGVDMEQEKDVIRKHVTDDFVPQVEKLSGFINYTLAFLTDGTVMSVSIFNSEASIGESIRLASLWINQNLPKIFEKNPEIFCGEIAVQGGRPIGESPEKKSA
ncbi:MAG: hypothetical protein ACJ763_16035 [Bdellovibrionia bacterium]